VVVLEDENIVTGVNGQLRHDLVTELKRCGHFAIGSGSSASYIQELMI